MNFQKMRLIIFSPNLLSIRRAIYSHAECRYVYNCVEVINENSVEMIGSVSNVLRSKLRGI